MKHASVFSEGEESNVLDSSLVAVGEEYHFPCVLAREEEEVVAAESFPSQGQILCPLEAARGP